MISIEVLHNVIQEYEWGSNTAIAELLGQKTSSKNPQAELWMGAHPCGPSILNINGKEISLVELIKIYPEEILGKNVVEKFGNDFPFMLKVLAAKKPLSIQVHPDSKQAKQGFKKENQQKIPLNSFKRSYKDNNHKPECICALTDFWALNGFRSISAIVFDMEKLSGKLLGDEFSQLKKINNATGLKHFYKTLMTLDPIKKDELINTVVLNINKNPEAEPFYRWIIDLHQEYRNDIGVLSPLLLNLICLKPGEAMFLSSGGLHSYLKGVGIELMANSDNVIRGGLTSKYVDISELLRVTNFQEKAIEKILPTKIATGEQSYLCVAKEFVLSIIQVKKETDYKSLRNRSVEIMICIYGSAVIMDVASEKTIILKKGKSILIPAAVNEYYIKGDATLYKAAVPT